MPELIYSTPEGVPPDLLDLCDRLLFSTLRCHPNPGSDPLAGRVSRLHDRILDDHRKMWYQLCLKGFDLQRDDYRDAAGDIVDSLPDDRRFAIVDPRLCLMGPLWHETGGHQVHLLYYGHPLETAILLQSRWRFPLEFGVALWEHYVVSALSVIGDRPRLLISSRDLSSDSLAGTFRRYVEISGTLPGPDLDAHLDGLDLGLSPVSHPDPDLYLGSGQAGLYEALEAGDLDGGSAPSLSARAADILVHYGNLRAGYDAVKSERDSVVTRLHESVRDGMDDGAEPDAEGESAAPLPTESLVAVTVHVRGMEPLEFLAERDSPVVDMLNSALAVATGNPDELIYLEGGESATAALYFSRRDLLAVDVSPASN